MKTINLIIFGIGNVGAELINQTLIYNSLLPNENQPRIYVPILANSKKAYFTKGLSQDWQDKFQQEAISYTIESILSYKERCQLKNCVVIDATACENFVHHYPLFLKHHCHIVAANKAANSSDIEFYKRLRTLLQGCNKTFLYETNVGAALPIIETVKNLNASSDTIHKIRGVFSGSLSYLFNRFSEEDVRFSQLLTEASEYGFTEPDARDDLSGKDVARKVLILARELGVHKNLDEVKVQSLVPKHLNGSTSLSEFNSRKEELDVFFQSYKTQIKQNTVLRYIGELDVAKKELNVSLQPIEKNTPLGQLKDTDNLFEIYSAHYKINPLVIQGAGAGKEVTASGVLTDVLKIAQTFC